MWKLTDTGKDVLLTVPIGGEFNGLKWSNLLELEKEKQSTGMQDALFKFASEAIESGDTEKIKKLEEMANTFAKLGDLGKQ